LYMIDASNVVKMVYAEVSVIIPCYRCVDSIRRALTSVFEQTLRPFEVLLIDDYSGDGTLEFLYQLRDEFPENWIKVIALPHNMGPASARNAGWECASQPFVAFLDSDDSWHPQKTQIQLAWMKSHPDVSITGQDCIAIIDESNDGTHLINDLPFHEVSGNQLLASNRFSTSSVIVASSMTIRFFSGKRYCEDYLLWCHAKFAGYKCYRYLAPLAYSYKPRYGDSGLSGNLWRMERGELFVYSFLFRQKMIGLGAYATFGLWSVIRFVRRTLKVTLGMNSL
jgi:glycosyltransferase involved in cell wall biosynthesis